MTALERAREKCDAAYAMQPGKQRDDTVVAALAYMMTALEDHERAIDTLNSADRGGLQ